MSKNKEIQCEYCTVRSNENKCKALEIEFHNCLNILESKKCPIYKLKQQLKSKKWECEKLKTQYNCYACETCKGKEDYRNMKRHCENAIKAIHKYQQALDRIQQEVKWVVNNRECFNLQDADRCDRILDIINKAKE